MQNNFFGSKLNSFLLLILIILMIFAIFIMLQNKEVYFGVFGKRAPSSITEQTKEYFEILGNKQDLVTFSIAPNANVSGVVSYSGIIKGAYFFEANILINILDSNKKVLKRSNAMAKTEWMTSDPVEFEGIIDFTGLPKGPSYFEIHNDNPSDLPENDKSILVPIIIE